jgi:uncharacterized membrane protein
MLLAGAIAAAALSEYRRPLRPLTRLQRGLLVALRALVLASLVLFLFRPIIVLPPSGSRDAVVPILIDVSRSMRLGDADGQSRLSRTAALVKNDLLPKLSSHFAVEIFGVGDGLAPSTVDALSADARRTDLTGALAAARERYHGQRIVGIVVISDGGDTGSGGAGYMAAGSSRASPVRLTADGTRSHSAGDVPVFTNGVGSAEGPHDREVLGIVAGDPRLDEATVDLHVTAVSNGFGRTPFSLRLLANGQPVDTRRIVPQADGSPIDQLFTVSPDQVNPTVYTAEVPSDASESVTENNARSVFVSPPGRKRRVLAIEGAPGFEHSFMARAWAADSGLEVDSVTRKGKNGDGVDTFFVQAGAGRSTALTGGFPSSRDVLYSYDGIVIANVEGEFFTRTQLSMLAEFVAERGGGLLVLGGRSFAQRGLAGTPLEEVLPVELNDRRGAVVHTAGSVENASALAAHNKLTLTADGEMHPVMRIGSTLEETRKKWSMLPPLAASAPLGGPRPGASVLAATTAPGGGVHPVVAVQRYGRGRSMVFAGEASWRWKMMVPAADRSHEFFWRQAARWLTSGAPDPVAITVPDAAEPGDAISVDVDARDSSFVGVPDASVDLTVTAPGGDVQTIKPRRADGTAGHFTAPLRPDRAGLYRVHAEARPGAAALGTAERWMYVGGGDREFADPRLNEGFLRRIARDSGGRYVRAADAGQVPGWLQAIVPQNGEPERRDLWHEPWAFALIVVLLSGEWVLRRRWGLR